MFACELTGNETIVTCQVGSTPVIVQMGKDFDVAHDSVVGVKVEAHKACLFDPASGNRIKPGSA